MSNLNSYNQSAACNNAYTIGCDALCRRQHYCVCVNFLRALEEHRIGESFLDCQKAVKNGRCVAYKMREEEKQAGAALYFQPRAKRIPVPNAKPISYAKRPISVREVEIETDQSPSDDDLLVGASMADALNAAVQDCHSSRIESPTYPKPQQGESLLDFAFRFRNYEKQKTQKAQVI